MGQPFPRLIARAPPIRKTCVTLRHSIFHSPFSIFHYSIPIPSFPSHGSPPHQADIIACPTKPRLKSSFLNHSLALAGSNARSHVGRSRVRSASPALTIATTSVMRAICSAPDKSIDACASWSHRCHTTVGRDQDHDDRWRCNLPLRSRFQSPMPFLHP